MSRCLAMLLLLVGVGWGQAQLEVKGDVWHVLELGEADLKAMPRQSVVVRVDGKPVRYEGVWLHEVLQRAELKSRPVFGYVVARAEDGYRAVFALAELDPAWTDLRVLVADRANGERLSSGEGPLRLVAAGDKKAGRWVKRLVSLEVELVQN